MNENNYSLLSYNELQLLIDDGVITKAKPAHVNSASIDIQLGKTILIERPDPELYRNGAYRRVSLKNREQLNMIPWDLEREGPYTMSPGEFILAHSVEVFHLPNNISAEYKLKSSMARIGLDHLNAGWCDAGWHGSVLTLELKNQTRSHEIVLESGDLIGQVIFFLHNEVPSGKDYSARGRYNNDKSVSGSKVKDRSIVFGDKAEDLAQEEYDAAHAGEEDILEEEPKRILDISEVRLMIEALNNDGR
jgi:dCTP deaminase